MQQTWLIAGPPGCGKTTWIRETLLKHEGTCAYLRLEGWSHDGLEVGVNAGIDRTWLIDQIPHLQDLSLVGLQDLPSSGDRLLLVEVQQFKSLSTSADGGVDPRILKQLSRLHLRPDRTLVFGRDSDLPQQDTLDFTQLEAWNLDLHGRIWDPNSLSSFWFELVNGAYGDVYRAKALLNVPEGVSYFCNWMVSQQGSQFLPLQSLELTTESPNRTSHLVIQGKSLNQVAMKATINDCILGDDSFELQQAQLTKQQPNLQPTK